jgi:hypothetical protein
VPADLRACFEKTVSTPAPGRITSGQAFGLIAALVALDRQKTACGRRLIRWAQGVAAS